MKTKVGGALSCAPTLMLQPWAEDRFESWGGRLADPSVVFLGGGGGADLAKGPMPRYLKTENATDLGHYFLGGTQIHFRKYVPGVIK